MSMPNITPEMYRRVCPYKTRDDDDGCMYPNCSEDCEGRRQFVTTFLGTERLSPVVRRKVRGV